MAEQHVRVKLHLYPQWSRHYGRKRKYAPVEWTVAKKSRVTIQIRSRNHIVPVGIITYIHGSTYQIIGPKCRYSFGRFQASKTIQLMGRPLLCVARSYLIKELIQRALILNLNVHHALKENKTHNMLRSHHNIYPSVVGTSQNNNINKTLIKYIHPRKFIVFINQVKCMFM